MNTKYIEHNGKEYVYTLIQDDTGCRVEVRDQDSTVSRNELPIIKEYLTENQYLNDDELVFFIKSELDKRLRGTMKSKPELTTKDHTNMEAFLGYALDDYKDGVISKETAIGGLAHVMAALDLDNYDEAREWFEQGRKFLRG